MKIAVDIDEVIVPLSEAFFSYHNKKFGTNVDVKTMNHYRYDKHMGISLSESFKRVNEFYQTDDFKSMKILSGVREALEQLSKNHELVVITSRYGAAKEFTRQWIAEEFPGMFSEILFSSEHHYDEKYKKEKQIMEKSHLCSEHNVGLIIEDSLAHSLECAEKRINVLLFDRPWNQGDLPAGITRFFSWKEVPHLLNSLSTASK